MRKLAHGTTLVETLIAIAIFSLLSLAAASFLATILVGEKRNRAVSEVEMQGAEAMYQITQSIRNGATITSPATSTSATTLVLVSGVTAENPTTISLASSSLSLKKGSAAAFPLTSDTVVVSGVLFQNISASSTRGAVRVSFLVSAKNPGSHAQLNYSQAFSTTVSLR